MYFFTWYTSSMASRSGAGSMMSTPPSPIEGVMRTDFGCSRLTSIATTASTSLPSSRVHSTRDIATSIQRAAGTRSNWRSRRASPPQQRRVLPAVESASALIAGTNIQRIHVNT